MITKAVTFAGALVMMLWYSPLMTAIAAGLTVLPLIASMLTGGRLQAAERRVSDRNRDFTAALSDCLGGFSRCQDASRRKGRSSGCSRRAIARWKGEKYQPDAALRQLVGMIGAD